MLIFFSQIELDETSDVVIIFIDSSNSTIWYSDDKILIQKIAQKYVNVKLVEEKGTYNSNNSTLLIGINHNEFHHYSYNNERQLLETKCGFISFNYEPFRNEFAPAKFVESVDTFYNQTDAKQFQNQLRHDSSTSLTFVSEMEFTGTLIVEYIDEQNHISEYINDTIAQQLISQHSKNPSGPSSISGTNEAYSIIYSEAIIRHADGSLNKDKHKLTTWESDHKLNTYVSRIEYYSEENKPRLNNMIIISDQVIYVIERAMIRRNDP